MSCDRGVELTPCPSRGDQGRLNTQTSLSYSRSSCQLSTGQTKPHTEGTETHCSSCGRSAARAGGPRREMRMHEPHPRRGCGHHTPQEKAPVIQVQWHVCLYLRTLCSTLSILIKKKKKRKLLNPPCFPFQLGYQQGSPRKK